jgi:hypothetical protein
MRCGPECIVALALAACDPGDGEADGEADDEAAADEASSDDGDDDSTGEPIAWDSLDERPCPDDSALTWENFGGPFVLTWCTGCHHSELPADVRQNAPFAINLETADLVRTNAARVWARAADQNATMPPAGAPALEERELFGEWLACGAP